MMKTDQPGFLNSQLEKIHNYIPQRDVLNPEVSKVSVAWHLDHMLKTINRVTEALEKSDPEKFKKSFSVARTMSLTFNYIPRGRAQSPKVVRPPAVIETAAIKSQLKEARENMVKVFIMDENVHFDHPVFGTINRGNALRFIEVHTNHHLKIVRDIIGK